jgi:hypothetical protein
MALVAIILFTFAGNFLKFLVSVIIKIVRLIRLKQFKKNKTVPVKPSENRIQASKLVRRANVRDEDRVYPYEAPRPSKVVYVTRLDPFSR